MGTSRGHVYKPLTLWGRVWYVTPQLLHLEGCPKTFILDDSLQRVPRAGGGGCRFCGAPSDDAVASQLEANLHPTSDSVQVPCSRWLRAPHCYFSLRVSE